MKYYLHYVEDCSPKIKVFRSKKELQDFTDKFPRDGDDNYLDYSFTGLVRIYDEYYEKQILQVSQKVKRKKRSP